MGIEVIATILPVKKRTCKMQFLEKQNIHGISGKSSMAIDDNFTKEMRELCRNYLFPPSF